MISHEELLQYFYNNQPNRKQLFLAEPVFFHWRDKPRYHAVQEQRGHKNTTQASNEQSKHKKKTNKNLYKGVCSFYIFEIEQDKQMPKCLFIDQRDYSFHDFVYPFNRIKGIGTSLTIMDLIKSVPHHDVGSCLFFYQQGVSDFPSVKMPTMTIRCRCNRDMDVIPHHPPKHCKLCLLESLNRCRAVTNYFNYIIIFISN